MNPTRRITATAAMAALALALTGCDAAETPNAAEPSTAAESITVSDAWVKATDTDMTGGFGLLENTGDATITIERADADFAGMIELHETVQNEGGEMMMQPKPGGFSIEPGDSLTLEPGADHLMIMGLSEPLVSGTDLTVSLEFSDGSSSTFSAVVKDYSGANEKYTPETEMDMGDAPK